VQQHRVIKAIYVEVTCEQLRLAELSIENTNCTELGHRNRQQGWRRNRE